MSVNIGKRKYRFLRLEMKEFLSSKGSEAELTDFLGGFFKHVHEVMGMEEHPQIKKTRSPLCIKQ